MFDLFALPSRRVAQGSSSKKSFIPGVEALEERALPSAAPVLVDMSTPGAANEVDGVLFRQTDTQPTGTGFIHSFVRLQGKGKSPVVQGVNTDARPLQMDENSSPVFTHGLKLSDVPVVDIGGVAYREFLL